MKRSPLANDVMLMASACIGYTVTERLTTPADLFCPPQTVRRPVNSGFSIGPMINARALIATG